MAHALSIIGEFRIEPPVSSQHLDDARNRVEGNRWIVESSRIRLVVSHGGTTYGADDELQPAIDMLGELGHTVTGRITWKDAPEIGYFSVESGVVVYDRSEAVVTAVTGSADLALLAAMNNSIVPAIVANVAVRLDGNPERLDAWLTAVEAACKKARL